MQSLGQTLELGVLTEVRGIKVLAIARGPDEPKVILGPKENAILAEMPWPLRRNEWLHGRRVAKELLSQGFGLSPLETEVLPAQSEAPEIWVQNKRHTALVINISHTKLYAVAAVASFPVGIDVCDDEDGKRLPRIAKRVLSEGEAEECGAFQSAASQASVWAIKEAVLKLRIGGVFSPGAQSVRVKSLAPPQVANPDTEVVLLRLQHGMVAVAF